MYSNIGSLSNQGVEFMLNGVAIDNKNLKWDMGLNFTYTINKIEDLTSGQGEDYFVTSRTGRNTSSLSRSET